MWAPTIPQTDLRERILAALHNAKKPVTFKSLAKIARAKDDVFLSELESAVSDNQVYRWPDYRRSQYFWHLSPDEKAREAILGAAATHALTKKDLIKAASKNLPGFPSKRLEIVLSAMVAEKLLQTVPAFSGSSKLLIRTGASEAYLNSARVFLERKIRLAGFDPAGLFPDKIASNDKPAQPSVDAAALILEAVRSLEPVPGVPVSTLRLRNQLRNLTKQEFDTAALELRKKQDVFLSQHVDPYNISQEDKDLLIDGQDGTYYVAIALR